MKCSLPKVDSSILIFIKITDSIQTIEALPAQVKRVKKNLRKTQELITKRAPRYLLVTLVKYNDYLGRDAKNNTQVTLNNNDNNDNDLIEIDSVKEICLSNVKWVEAVKRNFLLIRFHEVSYRLN